MKYYELNCLISSNLSQEELKILQEKIKNFIQEEEGVLVETKNIIKKNLNFSLEKYKEKVAYLFVLYFNLLPEKLKNLEKKLKSEKQILRYLILSKTVSKLIKKIPRKPLISIEKIEKPKKEKIELKEIEEKLEEILGDV